MTLLILTMVLVGMLMTVQVNSVSRNHLITKMEQLFQLFQVSQLGQEQMLMMPLLMVVH
jgi:hypothetical protein